mmetsp:Transcript_22601/g.62745  ORF Transcript_22601/g.62745 Transcript_22601/m.62745 type:complete len:171 (+) Transcript_22601:479-991(+)|eukprot:CAMPEP_0117661464 /NCGR_PEP_ID=MMETSP0804-20121206/7550_1 /TAXON_ID=1074897 /ORGANISM="Tetraselmis astigmatica, Strain CCMP880" /LENGTH=170 /DNA_ID=CAMNT_0005468331 /DNA_START=1412 /DNA_END=1924 /DNA_ORIENTATION=+
MAGLMGIRAPLGVNVGSNGVVGTSAAAGTMPSSTQQVKQKGKVIHGSPKDSGNLLFMTAGHNKPMWDSHPKVHRRNMVISLSNIPNHVDEADIHQMLAPWSDAVVGLTCKVDEEEEGATRTFQAEMEYAAAVEVISELDRSTVAGHTLFVQSVGAESSRSSMDEVSGMDL